MGLETITDAVIQRVCDLYAIVGRDETARLLGMERDSVRRYVTEGKQRGLTEGGEARARLAKQIADKYDSKELSSILRAGEIKQEHGVYKYDVGGRGRVRIGVISDPHIGSKQFERGIFDSAIDLFHRESVDIILCPGDVTEGMSNRPGHVYELSHIGYEAQKEYGISLWADVGIPVKMIDGNHDRWYIKSAGAIIVKDIADACENVEFLGHDQADVIIDAVTIRMVHGEDGGSYAVSYRLQKFIEAMHQQADVPEVAIFAHAHKQGHISYMGVEGLSAGALQSTTPWMRSKRNYSALGFYILEIEHDNGVVVEFTPRWFPGDKLLRAAS